MTTTSPPPASAPAMARLRPGDLAALASIGLRTRKLRAGLSALGIAIGVAAIVAVLGLAASSQAALLAEIARLGTNLLTATNGQTLTGTTAELPQAAPGMIARLPGVTAVQDTGSLGSVSAYKSPLIPAVETNALSVDAATLGLPAVAGTSVAQGRFLNAATAREPVAVLRHRAAAGHRPDPARAADLGRRPVVLRDRHPQQRHLRSRDRLGGPGRFPGGPEIPALRRAPLDDLRPDHRQPGRHHAGGQPARRAGQPGKPEPG
jgi:hypothetical protein